ncbi:hypothetical protein D1872_217460 [compost metagenome]
MIHRGPLYDPIYMVAICNSFGQWFEQYSSYAFSRHISISALSKAFAPSFTRYKPALPKHQVFVRMNGYIDAASNGKLTLALLQALAGQMNGRQ